MAIGTAAAILGGASIIGGLVSSSASSKAASRATQASQDATVQNNALARETRDQNSATLAPFVQQGGAATAYINQLLGIGGAAPAAGAGNTNLAPGAAQSGFDAFRNSTGYQFRVGEGNRAITNNKAVSGLLKSGSTLKALTSYGQNQASAEFGNYLGALQGQQGVGLSAASAQAGVANNYSAQVQGNNSVNATNAGNAAIARANSTSNFVNGLLQAGSSFVGARG